MSKLFISRVLEGFFSEQPLYIPVTSEAGGIEAAMIAILVAIGEPTTG